MSTDVSPEHVRTERLWLDRPVEADLDDQFALHSDPALWAHFPSGRHPAPAYTAERMADWQRAWDERGLGFWSVRDTAAGPVVGCGGCQVPDHGRWWNLYYRVATTVQGRGYAVELARAAIAAAGEVDPALPVIAYLLEHNTASRRTAERLGLNLAWRGPDRPNPDPDAVRLVYVDRAPTPELVAEIEEQALG